MTAGVPPVGIVAYGSYLPAPRIGREEFVLAWGRFAARGISEKAIPDCDEDSMTMAVEAARACMATGATSPGGIGFLATASSTYPYDAKFHPATVAEALGLSGYIQAMQFGGSTKAGTEAVATAILDRLLHHSHIINIRGESWRLREKKRAGLFGGNYTRALNNSRPGVGEISTRVTGLLPNCALQAVTG